VGVIRGDVINNKIVNLLSYKKINNTLAKKKFNVKIISCIFFNIQKILDDGDDEFMLRICTNDNGMKIVLPSGEFISIKVFIKDKLISYKSLLNVIEVFYYSQEEQNIISECGEFLLISRIIEDLHINGDIELFFNN
jgi:hypothetical protein